ncbi:hypothetical protein COOONC_04099, partial [Cooperia oncophora]
LPFTQVRNIGKKLILDVYANGKRGVVFKIVSDEERIHQHPLLSYVLDEMAAINSIQARRNSGNSQSSTPSKSSSTKSVRISDDLPKRNQDTQSLCRHCGAAIEPPDGNGLEKKHYRMKCPLFMRCGGCDEVVMVSSLANHRRNDCRARDNYRTCSRCGESFERSVFHRHVGSRDCRRTYAAKCPLCAELVIPESEESWRKHLTSKAPLVLL